MWVLCLGARLDEMGLSFRFLLLAAYTYLVRLVACGVGGGDGGGALAKKKTETNIKYSRRPGLGAGTST